MGFLMLFVGFQNMVLPAASPRRNSVTRTRCRVVVLFHMEMHLKVHGCREVWIAFVVRCWLNPKTLNPKTLNPKTPIKP